MAEIVYVVLVLGNSASGKSTYIARLPPTELAKWNVVCPDDIRVELTGSRIDQTRNQEVWQTARSRIDEAIVSGYPVILDATMARKEDRVRTINHLRETAKANGVQLHIGGQYFKASKYICSHRNARRDPGDRIPTYAIQRMGDMLEADPPSLADGFDDLVVTTVRTP